MNAVKYFTGEKIQCLIGIAVALVTVAIALYLLLRVRLPFACGVAYAFLPVAGLLLIACTTVVLRSDGDIARVEQMVNSNREGIATEELPRMTTVMKNFTVLKWVEFVLIVIGLGMFFIRPSGTVWGGVGLGIFIQFTILLAFDVLAEQRGLQYVEYLRQLWATN